MRTKALNKRTIAALLAAGVLFTGCSKKEVAVSYVYSSYPADDLTSTTASTTTGVEDDLFIIGDDVDEEPEQEEEPRFTNILDLFDYKSSDERKTINFMRFGVGDGSDTVDFTIDGFKDSLQMYSKKYTDYGSKAIAFDSAGASVMYWENDDGSKEYSFCDAAVLEAAMDDSYMQVLKSPTTLLGMHLGTNSMYLDVSGFKSEDSDISNSAKYVRTGDGYELTVYLNGGYAYYFILKID